MSDKAHSQQRIPNDKFRAGWARLFGGVVVTERTWHEIPGAIVTEWYCAACDTYNTTVGGPPRDACFACDTKRPEPEPLGTVTDVDLERGIITVGGRRQNRSDRRTSWRSWRWPPTPRLQPGRCGR